jgi:PAS domain S-box-containing protein
MGQALPSVSQNPFGVALPSDVVGAAIERLNDIVMVTEADPSGDPGMRIIYVNPAFERITGYPSDEVLGRSPRFLQGEETSTAEVLRIESALVEHKPVRTELLNYRKDGTPFWVEIAATSVVTPRTGGEYFVFIERDITERKKGEDTLREHERSMATLFSNLPGMAYRCRNDTFWRMEFVSGGSLGLTGYEP